jgi:hypothetical protein
MRVTILQPFGLPLIVPFKIGEVLDVSEDMARKWNEAGRAAINEDDLVEVETAKIEHNVETADVPKKKRGRPSKQ